MLFSIVVPVYNSEKSLKELYRRIVNVFENEVHEDFELILIDDSSKDSSFAVMEELHRNDNRVKAISLASNFGQHKAIMCGFNYVKGDYIITMDDDLQHPPEEIPKLINKMNSSDNIDVVSGKYDSKKHSLIRNIGTKLTNKLTSIIFKKNTNLRLTSFRLMKRFVVDAIKKINVTDPRIGHLILKVSNRIENVTVRHDKRVYGKSGYTFFRLLKDFINNIVNNSDLPLRIVEKIGALSFLISFVLIIYYVTRYFIKGVSIAGFTTTIVLLSLFGGLILFSIGIIGKYLIKILTESKKFPIYTVRIEEID